MIAFLYPFFSNGNTYLRTRTLQEPRKSRLKDMDYHDGYTKKPLYVNGTIL